MKVKKILKTKLLLTLVIFISSMVAGSLLWPGSALGSCRINDLSLEKEGNFTKLTIYADQPFEFVHSIAETIDGKPYRVIIDCKDAIHNLPQHNFRSVLPSGTIKGIRTSQFQTEPEKIVRIVLDLAHPAIYKIVENGEKKKGVIALSTPQESGFSFWSAVENGKSSPEGRATSTTPSEKIDKETSKDKSTPLASSGNKAQRDLKPVENVTTQEAERKSASERRLSFADTSEIIINQDASKDKGMGEKVSGRTSEKMVLATSLTSPDILLAPNQKNEKLQSKQVEPKKAEANAEKEASQNTITKPSSPASLPIQKKENHPEQQKLSSVENSNPSRTRETSAQHPAKKEEIQKEESSLSQKEAASSEGRHPTVSVEGEAEKAVSASAEGEKTESVNPTAPEKRVALLSPKEKSIKGGVVAPESLVIAPKPEGSELQLVPQREIIYYHDEGKRDPFAPLTERITTDFGKIPLPSFESLKLVGILRDEMGNRALLEDEKGYGYILKNGDKIKNGYVISVEDNKIIFQIQEYGWSKTMTLELSNEY
jgi:hypothetical protein